MPVLGQAGLIARVVRTRAASRAWCRGGGGDVVVASHSHDPDGEVAQRCHDLRAVAGADLGGVLAAAVFLYGTTAPDARRLAAGAAAWSLVHGLATLWLNGNLPEQLGDDPEEITRLVARHLSIPEAMTAT